MSGQGRVISREVRRFLREKAISQLGFGKYLYLTHVCPLREWAIIIVCIVTMRAGSGPALYKAQQ